MPTKKHKTKRKPKVKKIKAKRLSKFVWWSIIVLTLFILTSLILLLKSGTGPLQFLTANNTINKIASDEGSKSGKKANTTTRTTETKSLAKSAKDTLPDLNKPIDKPTDTPAPANKKNTDDDYDKPIATVNPTTRSQATNDSFDKPLTTPTSSPTINRDKHDGPMGTSTPLPTPIVNTIINTIEGLLNNSTPVPTTPTPTNTPNPTPIRSINRIKNEGPMGSSSTPTPKLDKPISPKEHLISPTPTPTIAANGRMGSTSSPIPTPSPISSPQNTTSNLHAGDQCDEKFFNTIPSCNKCKDQRKIENTLSDGTKITSCQLGEPSVDSIVTSNDLADAQTGLFLDKSKNDGKKCDAANTSASNYCGKVCKDSTFVMVGSQPSCGIRDIVTEAKYCNGQPFHTWNSNLNECLVATPDINYTFVPYVDHGQEVVTGYNLPPQTEPPSTQLSSPEMPNNSPINLEKASIVNIFNKSKNSGKTCSTGSGLLSCENLCENVSVIPKDNNGNYISDENGFVFVCQ